MKTVCLIPNLLLLVLLAVCRTNTYGEVSDTCTEDWECTNTHTNCLKSNECTLGRCICWRNYSPLNNDCKLLKKIGEACDLSTEMCYSGNCINSTCICPNNQPASEDNKNCGRAFGESCASSSECNNETTCVSGACGCEKTKKHVVINVFIKTKDKCVHKNATLDVGANGSCNDADSLSTAKYCQSEHYCTKCPEVSSTTEKKCLSGAYDHSANKLGLGVLVLTAIFLKRH